jgi:hypothetical protein
MAEVKTNPATKAPATPAAQQTPAPRTDAQLVALFDYWQTELAAGRMTRDQARAQAQSLSPEDQQRLRAAVTARNEAAVAAAERSAAEATRAREAAEEAGRRSAEEARRSAEEVRRAQQRARDALGSGATPSPGSSPSNGGSSPRSGGSAPSGSSAPRSNLIDEPVSYHGGTSGMDIAGLATSAKYNPTNLPVTLAAIVSGLPKQALHMA